jgi:hypothetical protein
LFTLLLLLSHKSAYASRSSATANVARILPLVRFSSGCSEVPLAVLTPQTAPLPGPFRMVDVVAAPPEGHGENAAPPLPAPLGSQ